MPIIMPISKPVVFVDPSTIEGLGPRYTRGHPGPYAIADPELCRMFPGIENVEINPLIGEHVKGDADPPNLRLLVRLVKYLEPSTVLEIGTFRGKTTYNFAIHTPPHTEIATIALPRERIGECGAPIYGTDTVYFLPQDEIGTVFRGKPEERRIRQIFADAYSKDCERQVDEFLAGRGIDFAFIDAAHDFNSIRSNFENLVEPRLSEKGVVVFDNYGDLQTHMGVAHFLTQKAYFDHYALFWYAPMEKENKTTCVIFANTPEFRRNSSRIQAESV